MLRLVARNFRKSLQQCFCTKSEEFIQHLHRRIKAAGPVTVASYMKDVLTNPVSGYYMHRDVFGQPGDFITSPEVSQMFGELLGVWLIHEWMKTGKTEQGLNVVELGPGRGTLAHDILRVIGHFEDIASCSAMHLVEVSPKLSRLQEEKLCGKNSSTETIEVQKMHSTSSSSGQSSHDENSQADVLLSKMQLPPNESNTFYKCARSKGGVPVYWYESLSDISRVPAMFIANEFLDALPIHKFQKTSKGWREVFVNTDGRSGFCFSLASQSTPACVLIQADETRNHVEICPDAGIIAQTLSQRIANDGGAALIIDYGHGGEKTDTLRGFRNHKLHDVLKDPGTADITADVDFSYLRRMTGDNVTVFGPISQAEFLQNMAIDVRMKKLIQDSKEAERRDLISGYEMLISSSQMGKRFKFFAIMSKDVYSTAESDNKPAGFMPAF